MRLFDRADQLRISNLGICYRPWSDDVIPWSGILDVTVWQFRGERSIILHLAHPECFPSDRLLGKLAAANRMLSGGDIPISLVGTDGDVDKALQVIQAYRKSGSSA